MQILGRTAAATIAAAEGAIQLPQNPVALPHLLLQRLLWAAGREEGRAGWGGTGEATTGQERKA